MSCNRHNIYRLLASHSLDRDDYIRSIFYLEQLADYLADLFKDADIDGVAVGYWTILQQFSAVNRYELDDYGVDDYAVVYDPAEGKQAKEEPNDTILILHHGW